MKTLLFAALTLLIGCTEVVIDPIIEPPTPLAPRVRIATFNVHRFFDTVCDSGDCGPGAFEDLLSQSQFEARADELAQAIEALDADVILLQEIETQGCLDALVSRTEGRFSGQFAELGPAATVDVAVLSRLQMIGVERHRPSLQLADNSSSRPLIIVDEAHALRNPSTTRYRHVAAAVAGCHVLLISATPLHNRLHENVPTAP